jgi:hypothetical protein
VRWQQVEVLCSTNRKCFQIIRGLKDSAVARILSFEDSFNGLILLDSGLTMYKTKISHMNWFCHSCDIFFPA